MYNFILFRLILGLLLIMSSIRTYGQQKQEVILINNQELDNSLYQDIEGSPYYFEQWKYGIIKNKNAALAEKETVLLNYNGYTNSFEVRDNNNYIALDEQYYEEVRIKNKQKQEIIFKTGLHPKYPTRFVQLVHEGTDYLIIQDFSVTLNTREKEIYAGKVIVKKFIPRPKYFLIKDGIVKYFKLKKKELLKLLDDKGNFLKNHITTNKLKLDREIDLIELFEFYDSIQRNGGEAMGSEER